MEHTGPTLAQRLERLPEGGHARGIAIEGLAADMAQLGRGIASISDAFDEGELTLEAKATIVDRLLENVAEVRLKYPALAGQLDALEQSLHERVIPAFNAAKLRATVAHNDAHPANYTKRDSGPGPIYRIDVSTMRNSLVDGVGAAQGTGVNDVGRFAQSLVSWPHETGGVALNSRELRLLDRKLVRAFARATGIPESELRKAMMLQRVQFEIAVMRFAEEPKEAAAALERAMRVVTARA
jgi:hypothetical protein